MNPARNAVIALLLMTAAQALADAPAAKPAPADPAAVRQARQAVAIPGEPRLMSPVLRTNDLERSLRFYKALGMIERGRVELAEVTEVILGFSEKGDAAGIMLIVPKGANAKAPITQGNGYVRSVIRVSSVKTAIERFAAAGFPPERVGSHGEYQIAVMRDPDGYMYELVEFPNQAKLVRVKR